MSLELQGLEDALHELTDVLREIKDWLLTHKIAPASQPKGPMDQPDGHKCPLCGGPMKKRTARATGEQFYGCADFPDCTGTRNLNGKDTSRPRGSSTPRGVKPTHNISDQDDPPPIEDDVPF